MKSFAPLACILALASVTPAFAHAFLKHATPGVGSVVAAPPASLLLAYTENLEVPFCTVTVTGPAGAQVQTARPRPVPGEPAEIAVPVHITAPGTYKVSWHALSVDTHKTQGTFSFTVSQ